MPVCRSTKTLPIVALCWFAICRVVVAAPEDVVINEIHYQPDDNLDTEFVELHNMGATPVDLNGWQHVAISQKEHSGKA